MANPSSKTDRVYHQDYIARIRYSNVLPPPPIPPKLLDIPNTGLSSGQYTSASFASRLAREQPLNIEADAELGMPINVIGLPGIFDGDESSISSLENPPAPHPHDKPLLRPLSMLGKSAPMTTGVSFLRRTEYISSDQSRSRFESTTSKDLVRIRQNARKRKSSHLDRDNDPIRILRAAVKSFDIAHPEDAYTGPDSADGKLRGAEVTRGETAAWRNPRHPGNPDLKVLDSYPVLPDLHALPESGSYFVIKFQTNPVQAPDFYDTRLDVSMLRPLELSAEAASRMEARKAAYAADQTQPAPGPPQFDYEFFLPEDGSVAKRMKKKLNADTSEREDEALDDEQNNETEAPLLRYARVRAYETYHQAGNPGDPYGDTVAIALHDAEATSDQANGRRASRLQKAAYIYPIVQRSNIRSKRGTAVSRVGVTPVTGPEDQSNIDFLELSVRSPDEGELATREELVAHYQAPASATVA